MVRCDFGRRYRHFGFALELIRGLKERNPRKDVDFRHDIWRWKGHDFAGALHDRVRRWIDAAADPGPGPRVTRFGQILF